MFRSRPYVCGRQDAAPTLLIFCYDHSFHFAQNKYDLTPITNNLIFSFIKPARNNFPDALKLRGKVLT
jgi:hypothetical protein